MGNEAEDGKGTGGEREGCGPRMGALLFERRDGCAREDGRKGVRSRAPQERRSNNLTFGALFACGHAGLPWLGEGGMRGPAESNIYTIEAGCRHGHRRASSARASVERACALEAPRPCRRTHTLRRTSLHPGGPIGTTTRRGPARRARSIALSARAPGNDGTAAGPRRGARRSRRTMRDMRPGGSLVAGCCSDPASPSPTPVVIEPSRRSSSIDRPGPIARMCPCLSCGAASS